MLYLNIKKKNSFIYHDKQNAIETLIQRQSELNQNYNLS